MESKLKETAIYPKFVDWTLDAAKQNVELQDRSPQ